MAANQFDTLLRALSRTPSRRAMTRALSGLAFGGLLGLLHLTEADAKRHKKKQRRKKKRRQKNQPFCAGKNICAVATATCGDGEVAACVCLVTMRGEPFCSDFAPPAVESCSQCIPGEEECLLDCGGGLACARPCPNPL